MALYGYTIGEDRDENSTNGKQLDVYRFLIPSAFTTSPITPTLVGTVNIAGTVTNADLEGLGTNPSTGRVSAVNEARATNPPNPIDPVANVVNNVDDPFAPVTVAPTRTPSNLLRFGFESGADFGGTPTALYNISGNKTANLGGEPVGSSLYKITTANPGTISLVATAPTPAQIAGTQPTNPGKFADGLAIDNLNPGNTRAFASDFHTIDGNGNNLYKVDLLTGQLSAPIALRNSSGQPLNVDADSGLSFTNSGSQRLIGWLETGVAYEITGFQDDLNATGLGVGDGFATATLLANVTLPDVNKGLPTQAIITDYEGFTIVNE
uniref:Water stress protein n=1 Tax=Nostoc commune TaxID=1178 RepID=A0A2Z6E9H7_NOSCO|nr:water stress protein [Nostoc commune]